MYMVYCPSTTYFFWMENIRRHRITIMWHWTVCADVFSKPYWQVNRKRTHVTFPFPSSKNSIVTSVAEIWNPTIFNIIHWVAGTNDSSTKRLTFQALFFPIISFKILCKNCFHFFSYFSFYNFTKIKVKSFESPKSIRNYERKIMLGTSDAWLMSRLSNRTSEPAYHIEDW